MSNSNQITRPRIQNVLPVLRTGLLTVCLITLSACAGRQEAKNVASSMVAASDAAVEAVTAAETYEKQLIVSHNNLGTNYKTLEDVYFEKIKAEAKGKLALIEATTNAEVDAEVLKFYAQLAKKEEETREAALKKVYDELDPIKIFVNTFQTQATAANAAAKAAGTADYRSQFSAAAARSRYHRALSIYYAMELEARDEIDDQLAANKALYVQKFQDAAAKHKKLISDIIKIGVDQIDNTTFSETKVDTLEAIGYAGMKDYAKAVKSAGEGYKAYFDQALLYLKAFTKGGTQSFMKATFSGSAEPVTIKGAAETARSLADDLIQGPKQSANAIMSALPDILSSAAQSGLDEGKAILEKALADMERKIEERATSLDPQSAEAIQ